MEFEREKIDDLRDLLGCRDRTVASMISLQGLIDTTLPGDSYRSHAASGDVAYVFIGPRDKLDGTISVDKDDGTHRFTIEITEERMKTYTVYTEQQGYMEAHEVKARDPQHAAMEVAEKEQCKGTFHVHEGTGEKVEIQTRPAYEIVPL